MNTYRGTVQADKWPEDVTSAGSSWAVAFARAARNWQRKHKGRKVQTLTIRLTRGTNVKVEEDK